jgi:AraC-like DNA-binding protein
MTRNKEPYYGGNWHVHEEYELLYTIKGGGIRIVGDSISHFKSPSLVLTGPWMPHLFKNEETNTSSTEVDFIVIKFTDLLLGQDLFSLPELAPISELLKISKRGIKFPRKTCQLIHDPITSLVESEGPDRLINFLTVLKKLADEPKYKLLASPEFSLPTTVSGENRLNRVIDYISENFASDISLNDIADVAALTPTAFCRFFRRRTNKTAFEFINEYRISKACEMLINGEKTISKICFESGFNSFSSFNRTFRKIMNSSPGEFKEKYRVLARKET